MNLQDDEESTPENQPPANTNALPSRKAMHRAYEIMSQNDLDRRSGLGDAFITRSMLARLAAHIQAGQMIGAEMGGGGGAIVIDDNCNVSGQTTGTGFY